MGLRYYQKGMTIWGMSAIAVIVGFLLLIFIKIIPSYLTDFKVQDVLKSVAQEVSGTQVGNFEVYEMLRKRFEINDLDRTISLKQALTFESRGKTRIVRIRYDDITPLFYNISLLIEYDHSAEVGTIE